MVKLKELEKKHREGYLKKPVTKGELGVWEKEQVWEESWTEVKSDGTISNRPIKEDRFSYLETLGHGQPQ